MSTPTESVAPESILPTNLILSALSTEDFDRLKPYLTPVTLKQGQVLQESGEAVEYIHFVNEGMVSEVLSDSVGIPIEVGMVGQEGLQGIRSLLGDDPSLTSSIVQITGSGHRINKEAVRTEFNRGGVFQRLVLADLQFILAEAQQCALCNRLHQTEHRLARWMMSVRDRIQSDTLELTHEFIADMLGSRRPGVTIAAGILQEAGLISYKRGCIDVLAPDRLEQAACDCYGTIRHEYESLVRKTLQQKQRNLSTD